jgi:hypothetical protein
MGAILSQAPGEHLFCEEENTMPINVNDVIYVQEGLRYSPKCRFALRVCLCGKQNLIRGTDHCWGCGTSLEFAKTTTEEYYTDDINRALMQETKLRISIELKRKARELQQEAEAEAEREAQQAARRIMRFGYYWLDWERSGRS